MQFIYYRALRRFTGPVTAYRLSRQAIALLDAAAPIAAVFGAALSALTLAGV